MRQVNSYSGRAAAGRVRLLGIPRAQGLLARIRENAAALDARYPDVAACTVTVEERTPHAYQRRQFSVRLDLRLHGRELVVNRAVARQLAELGP